MQTNEPEHTIEEIKELFLLGELGQVILAQVNNSLLIQESELIANETADLVRDNVELGGSPDGFFYEGQAFAIVPIAQTIALKPIHKNLEDRAIILRGNRNDISQYITWTAHFISFLQDKVTDPLIFVVNIPKSLSKLSSAMKKLEAFAESKSTPEERASLVFQRDDAENDIFFLHFDRVDDPLNRFLFRRITR